MVTRAAASSLGGGVGQRVDNLGDDGFYELLVVALSHDPDHGLGARRADDEAARVAELRLAAIDGAPHRDIVERLAAIFVAHALQDLRQRLEAIANFADRPPALRDYRQELERGHETVARGREIRQDDMARLLAADIVAVLAHMLDHVSVADRRAREPKLDALQIALKPQIGHDGGDDAAAREPPALLPRLGNHRHELVAVDDVALLVHDHDAVSIAVEGDADIGAHLVDLADQVVRRGRTAIPVDVEAVGFDANPDDFGAEFPQRLGRHFVGCPIGAIDHRPDTVEADVLRQRPLGEFDVALARAVDAGGAADLLRLGEQVGAVAFHQDLDRLLVLVGELVAVGTEQLDAVVAVRVVRGGDHHAKIGTQRPGQHGDGRRRHRTELEYVHAHRSEARDERGLDHIAGEPRILTDHDAVAIGALGEQPASGHAHLERHFGGHRIGVSAATDTIRAKEFARHWAAPPYVSGRTLLLVLV